MTELRTEHVKKIRRGLSFEDAVLKQYGGLKHIAFKNGEPVQSNHGATVPDITRIIDGKIEAIECKSINSCFYKAGHALKQELKRRKEHLPEGTTQRIIFEDFDFTETEKAKIKDMIENITGCSQIDFMKREQEVKK